MRCSQRRAPNRQTGCHLDFIRALTLGHHQGAHDHVGLQPAIGIREQNPVAGGGARAKMAGVTLAQPTLRQHVHALHLYARVFLRELSEDFARAIGRAIIHDDEFSFNAALREQMTERLFDAGFLVPCGHHDRATNNSREW